MAYVKSNYQKFRGNPEQKLFYLINNFIGGINTEFTDDKSSVADLEGIINFDMDKLGTLHKRLGFGELDALSDIFNRLDQNLIPVVKNRTEDNLNPEEDNDNIVYMGLIRNDNNCFRNLAGFSGVNSFREYQKMYGFQNNTFILLLITTSIVDKVPTASTAWYYKCTLPPYLLSLKHTTDTNYKKDEEYNTVVSSVDSVYADDKLYFKYENSLYVELIKDVDYGVGESITDAVYERTLLIEGEDYNIGDPIQDLVYVPEDNIELNAYKSELPVVFSWDRNLLNIDTIEYYNSIYFANNDKCLVEFDREANITSNATLGAAFKYSGYSATGFINSAFKPTILDTMNLGYNVLGGSDVLTYVDMGSSATDSIQGTMTFNNAFAPTMGTIPASQPFMVGIYYTGSHSDFTLTFKDMTTNTTYGASDVTVSVNSQKSTTGLKVYDVQFNTAPRGEVEIKIEMQSSSISPQYDYYNVGDVSIYGNAPINGLNFKDFNLIFINNRAVYYKDDIIYFSYIDKFDYVPHTNFISLPLEPTDKITKICYFKKSYIIFTKYKIYKLVGTLSDNSASYSIEIVNESIGCHAGNTVVPIDNTLYFASPRGIYALKSNQFVEGYENVVELDVKVKTLTSDYTLYAENRDKPAVRYNGINEHAYAFRYKDKYMLFYNNYGDKGDYAAENGLDVLTYQYEIGSYTTYRFKEKPTFLFMVDNAIESLSTVKVKEEFTESNVLFDYDFTTGNDTSRTVIDNSGNGNNGSLTGDALLNRSNGISLNGTNSFGQISDFSGTISNGVDIIIDTKCDELNGAYLIDLQQESSSINAQATSGSFETNKANNYYARLEYTISPNMDTKKDTVSYKLYYLRNGAVPNNSGNLSFSITGTEGTLVSQTSKSFNISSGSQLVASGNFTITRNSSGAYSSRWSLNISSSYTTTSTSISKGADVNLSGQYWATTTFNWIQLGFSNFVARATDTGCTITYTPSVKLTSGLRVGNRTLTVNIDGNEDAQTVYVMSYATANNPYVANGISRTLTFNYTGTKTIKINIKFAANFTRSSDGKYYGTLSMSEQTQNLPSVTQMTVTNTTNYSITGSTQLNFSSYGVASYRQIALKINGNNDQLDFILTSEYGDALVRTDAGIGLLDRHNWRISINSSGVCTIYRDNVSIKTANIDTRYLVNTSRTYNFIGTDRNKTTHYEGEIYNFSINGGATTLLDFKFTEGTGNTALDSSGYNRNMILSNISWLVVQGLVLKDSNAFITVPKLTSDIPFTNGFKIEFEGVINADNKPIKVIDLAKAYQSETSSVKFNSINVSFQNNLLIFNSTGVNGRTYTVMADDIDTTINHEYKIDCVDNNKGYNISIYVDNILKSTNFFNYGGIADIKRASNLIGKSNDSTEDNTFKGNLLNMKVTIYGSASGTPVYRSAIYEFDTMSTDFGRPIYIEAKTKGINMEYPQHMKKLKHTFIKAIGGDELSQLFFEIYVDGYLVNDPHKFVAHFDEDGTIVLDYTAEENLDIEGVLGRLGGLLVDKTKPGEGMYQTIKMIVPKKGKNFNIRMYGESEEFLTLESFGMVCKLGKVKQG